jgi:putative hydrolases of HD superfamily
VPSDPDAVEGILAVLADAGRLKKLKRSGWVRVGIPDPESVADHTFRLALLALLVGPHLGLNVDVMIRLALIHDLGEARVGDLTPADRVPPSEKRAREVEALSAIVDPLPDRTALYDLWGEYDAAATAEARVVRQLDKLEMAVQALEYELAFGRDLSEFWASARAGLSEPLLLQLFDRLEARRPVVSSLRSRTADRSARSPNTGSPSRRLGPRSPRRRR